jgi:hypothetical protein
MCGELGNLRGSKEKVGKSPEARHQWLPAQGVDHLGPARSALPALRRGSQVWDHLLLDTSYSLNVLELIRALTLDSPPPYRGGR